MNWMGELRNCETSDTLLVIFSFRCSIGINFFKQLAALCATALRGIFDCVVLPGHRFREPYVHQIAEETHDGGVTDCCQGGIGPSR